MVQLTNRQHSLIYILRKQILPVKSEQLCQELNISQRTLRYDINDLNSIAKCKFIKSGSTGYYIDESLDVSEIFTDISLTDEEDFNHWIAIKLIDYTDMSIYHLAEDFAISTTTINNLLPQIKSLLKAFNIDLVKHGYDLSIKGSESDKRRFLMHFLYKNGSNDHFYIDFSEQYYDLLTPKFIHELVNRVIERMGVHIGDIYNRNVVLIFSVVLQRIHQGYSIEDINPSFEISPDSMETFFIDEVVKELQEETDVIFSDKELKYLYVSIISLIKGGKYTDDYNSNDPLVLKDMIQGFLKETMEHFELDGDYLSIIDNICNHIFYMIQRIKNNTFFNNDISNSIRHSNPYVYDVALYFALKIEKAFNISIPGSEIGLLALYIGSLIPSNTYSFKAKVVIVCPNYNHIQNLLERAINKAFPSQIEIVDIISGYPALGEKKDYDFIISVLDKHNTLENVVYISPLIGPKETEKIEAKLIQLLKFKESQSLKNCFKKYFSPEYFFYNEPLTDGNDILKMITDKMVKDNIIPKEYYDDVIKREKLISTAFFNRFAVPHSLEVKGQKIMIAYYYSSKPISWFGVNVNTILLLVTKEYDENFSKLYELLFEIMMNNDWSLRLQQCKTYEEMLEFASNIL